MRSRRERQGCTVPPRPACTPTLRLACNTDGETACTCTISQHTRILSFNSYQYLHCGHTLFCMREFYQANSMFLVSLLPLGLTSSMALFIMHIECNRQAGNTSERLRVRQRERETHTRTHGHTRHGNTDHEHTLFLREKWLAIFRQHSVTLFHILAAVLGCLLGEGGDGGAVKATVYLEAGTKE